MITIKHIKTLLFVLFISSTVNINAQNPTYNYQFDGQVKWMLLTQSGTLLASTGEALVGIRPNVGELAFKIDRLKNVKEENLEFVPGTPYLIIKPKGMYTHTSVVDVVAGKMVFDSKEEDWKGGVSSRYFITPEMKFVVNGMHKEEGLGEYKGGVGLYDMLDGKLIRIFERKSTDAMSGRPDIMGDNIVIPGLKTITCYSIQTGEVKWESVIKNATQIITHEETQEIYAFRTKGTNTEVYKIDASNGNSLWPDENSIKGVISRIEFTDQGLAIVTNIMGSGQKGLAGKIGNAVKGSGQSKIYLLDINQGHDLWDKSPKTKGLISHFYIEPDGVLFGVSTGGINKVSFDGVPVWKKPYKTGPGIQIMARVKKGVLYISETDTDVLDLNTGESVFGKPVKYKNSASVTSAYDVQRNKFLISCKDGVYEVDGENGSYNLFNGKIDFEGKEDPTNMIVRDHGILLSSDQNLKMLNFDGKESWHTYYKAPGISTAGKIFLTALAVGATAMSSAAAYQAGANKARLGPYHSETTRMEGYQEGFGNIATASFAAMSKRFKATKATENASFILTKLDDGVGLVKVDKDSGKKVTEIVLNDKKPVYEVDDIEGVLYFQSKGNTISAYNLK